MFDMGVVLSILSIRPKRLMSSTILSLVKDFLTFTRDHSLVRGNHFIFIWTFTEGGRGGGGRVTIDRTKYPGFGYCNFNWR